MDIFSAKFKSICECIHRSSAFAVFALIGSSGVVSVKEMVQVCLNILKGRVDLFSEIHLIELIKQGLVEPFSASICLWMSGLGPAMFNIVKIEKQLIGMAFPDTAVLCPPVCNNPHQRHILRIEERQDFVI